LGNDTARLQQAVAAGQASGERLCAFPLDEDYEPALDSKVADIKQCTLDGEADHILAARFLKRFLTDKKSENTKEVSEVETPWLHIDLSASRCEGGLGMVSGEVTGFGVAWGLNMLGTV
jgi:leucyl aminopeptidase